MPNTSIEINLTIEEVDKCTRGEDVVRFITGSVSEQEAADNKSSYKEVFRPKLLDAIHHRSGITFQNPPRASGSANMVFYIQCNHQKGSSDNMTVSYCKADLVRGNALKATFKLSCMECQGKRKLVKNMQNDPLKRIKSDVCPTSKRFNDSCTSQTSNVSSETQNSDKISKTSFTFVRNNLVAVLNRMEAECMASTDPIQYLIANKAKFGLEANIALINSITSIEGMSLQILIIIFNS